MLPPGPKVAFAGGYECNDHRAIWAALDRVHAKHPGMVLLHGGSPKGAERIAACWADARKVPQVAFRPDFTRHRNAAPFKRNDLLLETLPIGVVVFPGSGISDNLADKARKLGIPLLDYRKGGAGQGFAGVSRWNACGGTGREPPTCELWPRGLPHVRPGLADSRLVGFGSLLRIAAVLSARTPRLEGTSSSASHSKGSVGDRRRVTLPSRLPCSPRATGRPSAGTPQPAPQPSSRPVGEEKRSMRGKGAGCIRRSLLPRHCTRAR